MANKVLSKKIIGIDTLREMYYDFDNHYHTQRRETRLTLTMEQVESVLFNGEFLDQLLTKPKWYDYTMQLFIKNLTVIKNDNPDQFEQGWQKIKGVTIFIKNEKLETLLREVEQKIV